MKDKIAIEVFYPHPPDRVWAALTEPDAIRSWLMPTTFKPILGLRFRFDNFTRKGKATVEGVVIELEQGKRLAYTWDDGEDGEPGVVAWTLHPRDGGTELRLEHQPTVSQSQVLRLEASLNWHFALYSSLPVVLRMLRDRARPPTPITYVEEDTDQESVPKPRAGFRRDHCREEQGQCC